MKLLQCTMLAAVAVASASLSAAHVPGARVAFETGLMLGGEDEAMEIPTSFLRRSLEAEAGSNVGPTTAPPPTTTAPPPTTTAPPPTTTAPPPTTTAPPPTTTAPPTTAPPTTAPPTTSPPSTTTPAPSTTGPATTTPKPSENNSTKTPTPTIAGPSTTTPPTSEGSNEGTKTTAPAKTEPLTSNSQSGDQKSGNKSSKMSTGTIIGIVGGIVVGVGILAVIAVVLARKRREEDDDPLSPFELSMDKGYNGAGASGYAGQQPPTQNPNQYNNNTALSYGSGARQGHNGMAVAGAAAVGAAAGAGAAVMMTRDTPSANADAAGVAYTQFYDPVTSPTSMYHQDPTQTQHSAINMDSSRTDPSNNGSNLWMSAMEPKENDVEGASMPPEISLPGDRDIDTNSSFVSRNSYDELPGTSVDIDQSSVLSGSSDLDKDFPDYEDESSRGSYEL